MEIDNLFWIVKSEVLKLLFCYESCFLEFFDLDTE